MSSRTALPEMEVAPDRGEPTSTPPTPPILPTAPDQARPSMGLIHKAMINIQPEVGKIVNRLEANTGKFSYNYAPLEDILDAMSPVLLENGCYVTFDGGSHWGGEGGGWWVRMTARITHEDGSYIEGRASVPIEKNTVKGIVKPEDPRGVGIATTYARRYAVLSVAGIMPRNEDTDGRRVRGDSPATTPVYILKGVMAAKTVRELMALWKKGNAPGMHLPQSTLDMFTTRKRQLEEAEDAESSPEPVPDDELQGGINSIIAKINGKPVSDARKMIGSVMVEANLAPDEAQLLLENVFPKIMTPGIKKDLLELAQTVKSGGERK